MIDKHGLDEEKAKRHAIRHKTINREVGRLVRKARVKKGLSASELANMIGISTSSLTAKERGEESIQNWSLIMPLWEVLDIWYPTILDTAVKNIIERR